LAASPYFFCKNSADSDDFFSSASDIPQNFQLPDMIAVMEEKEQRPPAAALRVIPEDDDFLIKSLFT